MTTVFFSLYRAPDNIQLLKSHLFNVLQSNLRIDTSYSIFHYSYIKLGKAKAEGEQKSKSVQWLLSNFSVYQLSQP